MQHNLCPECGSKNLGINERQGEVSCNSCGLIIEETKFVEANFISEAIKKQATIPSLSKAESTGIEGKIFKNSWMFSTREKNLRFGNSKIESLSGRLNIPERVTAEAKAIFKQSIEKDLAIGRDRLSIVFASVYLACIIHGIPKTPLEVIIYSSVNKKHLLRTYRLIKKELGIVVTPIDPIDLIPRFASKLGLSAEAVTKANELVITLKTTSIIYGRRPETIVASVLYLSAKITGENRTQRDVANAVGVIEVTIRKISKDIVEQLSSFF